jgi:phosphoglycerol transferase MdoB-like AlkP superfamily enzyme
VTYTGGIPAPIPHPSRRQNPPHLLPQQHPSFTTLTTHLFLHFPFFFLLQTYTFVLGVEHRRRLLTLVVQLYDIDSFCFFFFLFLFFFAHTQKEKKKKIICDIYINPAAAFYGGEIFFT